MNSLLQNIEQKIKLLAQRCRDLEAENAVLKEELDTQKQQREAEAEQEANRTFIPTSARMSEKEENFQAALNNAKRAKRELELYLREMERKIEGIKF